MVVLRDAMNVIQFWGTVCLYSNSMENTTGNKVDKFKDNSTALDIMKFMKYLKNMKLTYIDLLFVGFFI